MKCSHTHVRNKYSWAIPHVLSLNLPERRYNFIHEWIDNYKYLLNFFVLASYFRSVCFHQRLLGSGIMSSGSRLTELDLSDNAFGPDGVKGIEQLLKSPSCHSLRELRLNNCGMGIGGGKVRLRQPWWMPSSVLTHHCISVMHFEIAKFRPLCLISKQIEGNEAIKHCLAS